MIQSTLNNPCDHACVFQRLLLHFWFRILNNSCPCVCGVVVGRGCIIQAGRVVPERVLFDHRSSMKTESEIRQKEKRRRATERDALKVGLRVWLLPVSLLVSHLLGLPLPPRVGAYAKVCRCR